MELTSTVLFGGLSLSFVVGFLTGVFGVGGGFLMTPCLIIFLGIPGPTAVGTDLAIILANSSFGLFKRRKSGTLDLKLALTIASGSLVGMVGGFYALKSLYRKRSLVDVDFPVVLSVGDIRNIIIVTFHFRITWGGKALYEV